MNTLLVIVLLGLTHGVLFYSVPDVLAQPLSENQRAMTHWMPYTMKRFSQQPMKSSEQPIHSSQYRYQSYHRYQPSSTFNQAPSGSEQQHPSSSVSGSEYHSEEYNEDDYPQSNTSREEDHIDHDNDWESVDEGNQHSNTGRQGNLHDEEEEDDDESQIQTPKTVEVQHYSLPGQQPSGYWYDEKEEDGSYEDRLSFEHEELLKSEKEEHPHQKDLKNSKSKHELISNKHESVTYVPPHETSTQIEPSVPTHEPSSQHMPLGLPHHVNSTQHMPLGPPHQTSTQNIKSGPANDTSTQNKPSLNRKKTSRYETLLKSHPPSHKLLIPRTVLPQHKNYPIPHSENPYKYVNVSQRLYYNPEFHSDLYGISDHSIHDSVFFPEVKAALRAKLHNA